MKFLFLQVGGEGGALVAGVEDSDLMDQSMLLLEGISFPTMVDSQWPHAICPISMFLVRFVHHYVFSKVAIMTF